MRSPQSRMTEWLLNAVVVCLGELVARARDWCAMKCNVSGQVGPPQSQIEAGKLQKP